MQQNKMIKVTPNNPKYAGVYYRMDKEEIRTFYINYRLYGRPKWEKVGRDIDGYNKTECVQLRSERIRSIKLGKALPGSQKAPTMDKAFALWLEWAGSNLKTMSITREESRYNMHIRPYFGHLPLDEIDPMLIERTKIKWMKTLQKSSVQMVMILMGRIYNKMDELDLYRGVKPLDRVRKINAKVKRLRWLTMTQADEVLARLKDIDIESYRQACFGLYAGLRPVEIQNLTPLSIDLNRQILIIHNVKHATQEEKTRYVGIPIELLKVIQEMTPERTIPPGEKIFKRWRNWIFNKAFQPLNEGVNPRDKKNFMSFYTLRHTFASVLVEAGTHPKVIQNLMGHDNMASTEIYTKASPDLEMKAIQNVQRLWEDHRL